MQYYITTITVDGVGTVIDDYGTGLGGRGDLIETEIDGMLKHNYKLVDSQLVALTEYEKLLLIPPPQPSEIEILQGRVVQLTEEKGILAQNVYDLATIVEAIISIMPEEEVVE